MKSLIELPDLDEKTNPHIK